MLSQATIDLSFCVVGQQITFRCHLNRESLVFQTTPKSAPEELTSLSNESKLQNVRNGAGTAKKCRQITWKKGKQRFPVFTRLGKKGYNSAWSTPPDLSFASFDSRESQLSNDAAISA